MRKKNVGRGKKRVSWAKKRKPHVETWTEGEDRKSLKGLGGGGKKGTRTDGKSQIRDGPKGKKRHARHTLVRRKKMRTKCHGCRGGDSSYVNIPLGLKKRLDQLINHTPIG